MHLELPYFGPMNTNELDDRYSLQVKVKDQTVDIDINFKQKSIEQSRIACLNDFLKNIEGVIADSWSAIKHDFTNGSEVREFLNFHLEELDDQTLKALLSKADKLLTMEEQLLSVTKINRIGFYPDSKTSFAIVDFNLDFKISQYVLVVILNDNKTLNHITMES